MDFKTSKEISPLILEEYCKKEKGKSGFIVYVLKDEKGNIGAYTVTREIPGDSPVSYLDIEGNEVASFHIFSRHKDQIRYDRTIEELRKRFPIMQRLE